MKEKVKEEATVEAATESVNTTEGREERLEKLSRNYVLASMGVGLIPLPIVDLVALMGIQLNMVRNLAAEYDIPFRQDIVKSTIFSLMGGVLPVTVGCTLAIMLKSVPFIGMSVSAITMPVFSGACTYAIYKVFVQHFESGGTFLDLDPAKVKAYFAEQFAKGKKYATDLKTTEPAKTEA
jgi:uncharacterized protein (DUF697 family)